MQVVSNPEDDNYESVSGATFKKPETRWCKFSVRFYGPGEHTVCFQRILCGQLEDFVHERVTVFVE